jgi:hypothetical protein|tara:strand:+ start:312 stop:1367 length:1056 start_codon:yes stop_codon:yes gene_type:complete
MVRLILSKPDNFKDQLELYIDCYDTHTSKKWVEQLTKNIRSSVPLKKHTSFHGFIEDKNRTLKNIVDEIHKTVKTINDFDFAKHAFLTKQPKIKKDFNIALDMSIENLTRNDDFDLGLVNQLHDVFVQLEGPKTNLNLESVSPYFGIAPPETRWEISKINNLAHELFHYGAEYKRYKKYKWYNPEIHAHFYPKGYFLKFDEDDFESFKIGYEFGQVHLGDTNVGKTYWDAFNDNDDVVHNDELDEQHFIVGDFALYLGNTTHEDDHWLRENYPKWLIKRGLDKHKPALHKLGKPIVAKFDYATSFGAGYSQENIRKIMSNYCNIYSIIVGDIKSTYEWRMHDEEIDIKHHA